VLRTYIVAELNGAVNGALTLAMEAPPAPYPLRHLAHGTKNIRKEPGRKGNG
jgi:hypothetical protein